MSVIFMLRLVIVDVSQKLSQTSFCLPLTVRSLRRCSRRCARLTQWWCCVMSASRSCVASSATCTRGRPSSSLTTCQASSRLPHSSRLRVSVPLFECLVVGLVLVFFFVYLSNAFTSVHFYLYVPQITNSLPCGVVSARDNFISSGYCYILIDSWFY